MKARAQCSLAAVIAALTALGAVPVLAQSNAPGGQETLPEISVTGTRDAEKAMGPADSQVAKRSATGTKTDTALIETPQSISVVTQQQIELQGLQGAEDTLRYVAGAIGGAYGFDPRSDWMLVRGFDPARFLDGMALPRGVWTGDARQEVYGMERMEVLKGPYSVVYGQMPPGGMVNMVSKRPNADQVNEVEVTAGTQKEWQGAFDLGGKATKDGDLLFRVTGLVRNSDTPVDYSRDDRYYIAPSLTWQPSADTSLTLLTRYQYNDAKGAGGFLPSQGTIDDNPNGKIPISRFAGEQDFETYRRYFTSAGWAFDHRFNDTWSFHQNFRYAQTNVVHDTVGPNGLQDDLRTLNRYTYTPHDQTDMVTFDNNVEAKFSTGAVRHTVLAGVDYSDSTDNYQYGFGYAPPIDIFNPVYGALVEMPANSLEQQQKQWQVGTYVQDQMRFDRWTLTASGRYDWVDTGTLNKLSDDRTSQKDQKFSGRLGVNYLFDSGIAPYASYSRSFQPTLGTDYAGQPFKATTGEQYEGGVKYQPAGIDALFTLAAYQIEMHNTQTVDPDHIFFSVQQGETKVRGVEFEARANLTRQLSLIGAVSYNDAKVTKSNDPASLDKRVPMMPKVQASLWADYTLRSTVLSGLGFGGGVRYIGDNYGDSANDWKVPSYTLADAVIHYEHQQWLFQLNGSNIFNREYISACNGVSWCYYGYPRTATFTAKYRW